jgi:O-antigen/teichoic acid export membrane protein
MDRGRDLARNTLVIGLGRFAARGLNLVMLPVYTRVLTTAEYGTVDLITAYTALIVPLLTVQTEMAVFRFLVDARGNRSEQTRIVTAAVLAVSPAMALLALVCAIAGFWTTIPHGALLACYSAAVVVSGLSGQIARGLGRNLLFAASALTGAAATLLCNLWLVVAWRQGVTGMLISLIAANLAITVLVTARLGLVRLVRPRTFEKARLRAMWAYSGPLVPSGLAWWVVNMSGRAIVAAVLGTTAVGVYAVATRYALVVEFGVGVIALSWAEAASKHIADSDRNEFFGRVFAVGLRAFGAAGLVVVAATAAVFDLLTGPAFHQAYIYVPPLVAAAVAHGLVELYTGIYIATKRTKRAATTSLAAAAVGLTVNLVAVWYAGLWAAVAATLTAFVFMAVIRHRSLRSVVQIKYNHRIIKVLLATAALVTTMYYLHQPWATAVGVLAAAGVAGALNWRTIRLVVGIGSRLSRPGSENRS